jgi:hypothetical protein
MFFAPGAISPPNFATAARPSPRLFGRNPETL